MGCSITGPSCYDRYRQYHCCSLYQQTGWDPFPCPVAAGSRSVSVATDSGHNSLSQTYSRLPQCDSRVKSRPVALPNKPITTEWSLHPEVMNLIFRLWRMPVVDMFATVHNTHPPQFMSPVSEPQALAIDGLFSREVSKLAAVTRRPSTNRMYDNRWLRFAYWATIAAQIAAFLYELFDTHGLSPQTIKGYRSCLALVLSRTGKAAGVQAKTISDDHVYGITEA